jgi:hypothetical protein
LRPTNNGLFFNGSRKNKASWKKIARTMPLPVLVALALALVLLVLSIGIVAIYKTSSFKKSESPNAVRRQLNIPPNSNTPGLWIPHIRSFMQVPSSDKEKVVCISSKQHGMARAFQTRGWKVIWLGSSGDRNQTVKEDTDACSKEGWAHVIWTKSRHNSLKLQKPWQRYSWIPHQNIMSGKASLLKALQAYAAVKKQRVNFIPETFTLPKDRDALLDRLKNDEGLEEPWVIKLASTDNGIGIAIVGPQSDELKLLSNIVDSTTNMTEAMPRIRELVHVQPNDQRNPKAVEKARERSLRQNDDIIVQRYVCNELPYKGHKFDLRIYYFIASVDPLVVFYHDGSLRVALGEYKSDNFTSTHDHLTNLGQNRGSEEASAGFEDWEISLREHVNKPENIGRFTNQIRQDPLNHIRKQIKSALAQVVASLRERAFRGYPPAGNSNKKKTAAKKKIKDNKDTPIVSTYMENGFALMGGDFIVDQDLRIYMTEAQSSPGLSDSLKIKHDLNDRLLTSKVAILEHVFRQQATKQPLFPSILDKSVVGDFEIIYTDDFQYQYPYDNERTPQRGPCKA